MNNTHTNPLDNDELYDALMSIIRDVPNSRHVRLGDYGSMLTIRDVAMDICEECFGEACELVDCDADWREVPESDKAELIDELLGYI